MNFKALPRDKVFNFTTVGMILSIIAISSALELGPLADITALVIFGTLSAMNKVTFANGIFWSSNGDDLSHKMPTKFGEWAGMIVLITFIGGFIGIVPFGYNLFASVFAVILSYFIFTNCPMSMLLNEDAWKHRQLVFGIKPLPKNYQDNKLFDDYYDRRRSSPSMSNNPCNIYYKSHK